MSLEGPSFESENPNERTDLSLDTVNSIVDMELAYSEDANYIDHKEMDICITAIKDLLGQVESGSDEFKAIQLLREKFDDYMEQAKKSDDTASVAIAISTELKKIRTKFINPKLIDNYNGNSDELDKQRDIILDSDNIQTYIDNPDILKSILINFQNDTEVLSKVLVKISPNDILELSERKGIDSAYGQFRALLDLGIEMNSELANFLSREKDLGALIKFYGKFKQIVQHIGNPDAMVLLATNYEKNPEVYDKSIEVMVKLGFNVKDILYFMLGRFNYLKENKADLNPKQKKEMYTAFFKYTETFMGSEQPYAGVIRRRFVDAYNQMYIDGWVDNSEKDQLDIAQSLSTNTILTTIASSIGTEEGLLNISHKTLVWVLSGDKRLNIPRRDDLLSEIKSLDSDVQKALMVSLLERKGRAQELFKGIDKSEVANLYKDLINYTVKETGENIIHSSNIIQELLRADDVYGFSFQDSVTYKFVMSSYEHCSDEVRLALACLYPKYKEYMINFENPYGVANPPVLDRIAKAQETLDELSAFNLEEHLDDGVLKSASLFVWDPENTNDTEKGDKVMQLWDFMSSIGFEVGKGGSVSSIETGKGELPISLGKVSKMIKAGQWENLKSLINKYDITKITVSKKVGGLIDQHDFILSNNNSHKDFAAIAEDESYSQVTLRGHCWSTEGAIKGYEGEQSKIYERSNALIIINGGCYQEQHVQEFRDKFDTDVYQVATTNTGKGTLMTREITYAYRQEMLKAYNRGEEVISMVDVGDSVKKLPFYKRAMKKDPVATQGYTFTKTRVIPEVVETLKEEKRQDSAA